MNGVDEELEPTLRRWRRFMRQKSRGARVFTKSLSGPFTSTWHVTRRVLEVGSADVLHSQAQWWTHVTVAWVECFSWLLCEWVCGLVFGISHNDSYYFDIIMTMTIQAQSIRSNGGNHLAMWKWFKARTGIYRVLHRLAQNTVTCLEVFIVKDTTTYLIGGLLYSWVDLLVRAFLVSDVQVSEGWALRLRNSSSLE